jgi:hypothetical protein
MIPKETIALKKSYSIYKFHWSVALLKLNLQMSTLLTPLAAKAINKQMREILGLSGYVFEDNRNLYSSLISSLSNDFTEWSATETADLKCYIQAPIATKVEITAYVQSLLAKATPPVHPMHIRNALSSSNPDKSEPQPLLDKAVPKNNSSSPLSRVKCPPCPPSQFQDFVLSNDPEAMPGTVLNVCQARITGGMVRGAIELCHRSLIQSHDESIALIKHLQSNGAMHQPLIRQLKTWRNTIAALWCIYVQILLDIACSIENTGGQGATDFFDDKKLQPFLHNKEHRYNIMLVLVQEAIDTLLYTTGCPLVGNHVFIIIGEAFMSELETPLNGSDCSRRREILDLFPSSFISLNFQVIHDLSDKFTALSVPDPLFADSFTQSIIDSGMYRMKDDLFLQSGEAKSITTELEHIKLASRRLSSLPELPTDFFSQVELLLAPNNVSSLIA